MCNHLKESAVTVATTATINGPLSFFTSTY